MKKNWVNGVLYFSNEYTADMLKKTLIHEGYSEASVVLRDRGYAVQFYNGGPCWPGKSNNHRAKKWLDKSLEV